MTESYPLHWPAGRPRTPRHAVETSRFDQTQDKAQRGLMREIRLLGGTDIILSTNVALRRDGMPYASRREPDDQGVAVYFDVHRAGKAKQMAFACDRWASIGDNIHAIAKTIEALRGIERWGSGEMVQSAFSGFAALPPPPKEDDWREIFAKFGFANSVHNLATLELIYKHLVRENHPDNGGDASRMMLLNRARDMARKELA